MGQQQLMLTVLVTIIVGLMTIVGIALFQAYRDDNLKDIIRQDVMEAGTVGQLYYKMPTAMGGGSKSFVDITLFDIQLDTASVISTFEISETAPEYFKITATPKSDIEAFTAVVYSDRIEWE